MSVTYFKALADDTRLRLLQILSRYELNVNELVVLLSMGQSRISRHLKILTEAGLLTFRRDGLWIFYSVPSLGKGREFVNAILPFIEGDSTMVADMHMAVALIEERVRKTSQFFNEIADNWDNLINEYIEGFDVLSSILSEMPLCNIACDLGCGTGALLKAMQEKATSVIGVDGSAKMLELAKRRFAETDTSISLRIGDLSHLPLRDGEADFATLNMVLHHIPSPKEALMEVHRVINQGGTLVIADFNQHSDEKFRTEYGDHWLGFTKDTLYSLLEQAGFTPIKSSTIDIHNHHSLHIITSISTSAPHGE